MKQTNNLFYLFVFLFLGVKMFAQTPQSELEKVRQNYISSLIPSEDASPVTALLSHVQPESEISDQMVLQLHQKFPFNLEKIKSYLENIRDDGTWPDVNYADTKRSGWEVKAHAERILELAKLYKSEEESCSWGPKIEDVLHKALGYWFREKPVCRNWWYNQIGIPKTMGPAFLLFENRMTAEEKRSAIELMEQAKFGMTGQNKVWLAGNVLIRGLLQDDFELVKAARDTIVSEIKVGTGEGIKSDWSFHQHGPQQQFGNYGLAYLSEMSFYSGLFSGTDLAFHKEQQAILESLLWEGYRWIVWKGYLDVNCLDRQLFKNAPVHKALSTVLAAHMLMKGSDPANKEKMKDFMADNYAQGAKGNMFRGHKHFWDSDQTIHRTAGWMASLKMCSERVQGSELVNEDNLKGFYMGDGALYVYRRGDEYLNVFPFWDWRKIPGITSYESQEAIPVPRGKRSWNQSAFVGGVTDGETGITGMKFDRDGVKACKSWIFTERYVLCLGAGIRTDSCLPLTTSIDQRIKRGELKYYKENQWQPVTGTFASDTKTVRFFHDSTGYVLLQPATCMATAGKRTGRWCDFMGTYAPQTVEGETISLWIEHTPGETDSYQYLILPVSSEKEVAEFPLNEIRVLRNDEKIQVVSIENKYYMTAYEKETVRLDDRLQIEVETPGIYQISPSGDGWRIEAADPTHARSSLSLTFNGKKVEFEFPAGSPKGKRVSVVVRK